MRSPAAVHPPDTGHKIMITDTIVNLVLLGALAIVVPLVFIFCWQFFREGGFNPLFEK
jgi:uncharacterized membrane protein